MKIPALSGRNEIGSGTDTANLRNAEHICRMPELAEHSVPIRPFCLIAALILPMRLCRWADTENTSSRLVLSDVSQTDLRGFSTQIVNDRLTGDVAGPKNRKNQQNNCGVRKSVY
jgi:hypothetical protein